ncbi:MAG: UvrB/UvrC motif-containing protein [Parcubacteria group bacterium]
MNSQDFDTLSLKSQDLPDSPGVYFFLGPKKEILYVGKATSLKDRVRSYFVKDLLSSRGPLLLKMIHEAVKVDYLATDSVLEALILEANQIKKHRPPYNTRDKDNKSFNMAVITKEDYPRILVIRSRNLAHWNILSKDLKINDYFGPFPHGGELREALKIIRKIFPYRDNKCVPASEQRDPKHPRPCFNYQIGLCPGVCVGKINKRDYRKIIRRIRLFFEGRKSTLIKDVEKDMKSAITKEDFEEAGRLKNTLYSLEHIQDVALIKRDIMRVESEDTFRIEAYDIAHLGGRSTVGVMVVVEDGELEKSQYRKFRVRGVSNKISINDIENLKEVIVRRLGHLEWKLPNLIVVDGGIAQINAAISTLRERGFNIEVASVVKDLRHKAKEIIGKKKYAENHGNSILLANSEAHRFAIGYHRKLRGKGFRI